MVLGRNVEGGRVLRWLQTAASVPGFIGFAIGRTTFWDAVAAYVAKQVTRQEAAWLIARRYREWANVFEQVRRSHAGAA
jgi:myo-inositol catabolism protein IolC